MLEAEHNKLISAITAHSTVRPDGRLDVMRDRRATSTTSRVPRVGHSFALTECVVASEAHKRAFHCSRREPREVLLIFISSSSE
ncbi:hypothetical protein PCAR4_830054 [Paraburkholderia caribensis]|nr:hypothetical protein PCAR4_830054 [Paraburkholderia caribensis]